MYLAGWRDMWRGRNGKDILRSLATFGISDIAHIFKYMGADQWDKSTQAQKQTLVKQLISESVPFVLSGEIVSVESYIEKNIAHVWGGQWSVWKQSNPTETIWIKAAEKEVKTAYNLVYDAMASGDGTLSLSKLRYANWKYVNKSIVQELLISGPVQRESETLPGIDLTTFTNDNNSAGFNPLQLIKDNPIPAAAIVLTGLLLVARSFTKSTKVVATQPSPVVKSQELQ